MTDAGALLGKNFWEEFPEARDTEIHPQLHRVMDGGAAVEYEVFYPPWRRWYAVRAFPVRGGGLTNYFRDITEEKLAHGKLRESEARYRTLFDSIDEAFAVLDIIRDEHDRPVDYRFVEVNPAMERHTGWRDARGKTARELIENLEPYWPETYGKVERTGEPVRFVQGAEGMGRVFDAYAFRIDLSGHPQVAILFQDVTEQRATTALLAQLSEQRRLALDSAQMGWWHYEPATRIIDWDERTAALYGLPGEHVTYEEFITTIHPDDLPARDAAFQAAMLPDNPGAQYETEYRVRHPDGSWRWLQIRGKATFAGEEKNRRIASLDGTVADVTVAKEVQAALLESEAKLRQLADAMPQIVWTARPDGHVDYWNQRWYEYTGTQPGSLGDASWQDIVHPESTALITREWPRSVATGEPYELEIKIKGAAEGTYRWFLSRATPIKDAGGKIVRWIGTSTDIHEQKTAEAALAFERHQLELIFQETPAAMTIWRGENLVFTRVNPEYQNIFRGRQLVGLPLLEACPELAGQGFDDLLRRVLHTGEPFTGHEVLARIQRNKDGPVEDRYFDFTYLQVRDSEGNPWGVYDHAVDVSDRVTSRLAMEQSQRDLRQALADRQQLLAAEQAARGEAERVSQMKDEFLATLSHELRTPLNAILGWTQVLRGDPGNVEDVTDGLATIERNAKAQTQIIEDLLDMSKIISGKVRLDVQALHLDQLISAAVETMRPAATAKNIRLQALIDPQARMISGDPNRLQQVFWNLLSNAIKFTPKGGRVQVLLERVHSHLEVSVADTGEGIAPEFLPYVFDRFRQQDASTTRKHGGLGLGLAIVKQLVDLHGGSIGAESAGRGQGTTFRVVLPLSVVQPAPEAADPERRHPQREDSALSLPPELLDLAGIKVLVVDDELDARTLIKRLLEDRKAVVQTAGSVAEALSLLQSERPDVLVSDIGMPEADGYALIRQIRALKAEEGGRTPAIALTAYARAEDRIKAILAGFEMHLTKPVNAVELLALVAKLTGRADRFQS